MLLTHSSKIANEVATGCEWTGMWVFSLKLASGWPVSSLAVTFGNSTERISRHFERVRHAESFWCVLVYATENPW